MTEATKKLATFAAELDYDAIPAEVVARTKLLVLDLTGIALRARFDADSTPAMMQAVKALGIDNGTASVIGDRATVSPPAAALINGALGHSLDFDDTHAPASLHPSAPVVPAALAAAEMVGASGRDLLAGIVAGYETICRLSKALPPADHYDRGYHPTSTCGAFGAAAAAGRVLGLDAGQIANAFGIVLSQSAGSMQYLKNGAWTKRLQIGNAAMSGLVAASFAREGYIGAAEAIEGKYGFLHAYAPKPQPEVAVAGLGTDWETMCVAVKPYPACRMTHAPADAAIELLRKHDIDPAKIAEVDIGLSRKGIDLTADPQDAKRNPQGVVDGQFSMHFVAAVVLREGRMGWDDYAKHLKDPDTLALVRKVTVFQDPKVEAEYPRNLAGSVKITMADGATYEKLVRIPKGEPENFVTPQELRDKFSTLVRPYIGEASEAALYDAVMNLDKVGVAAFFRNSVPPAELAQAGDD